MTCPPRAFITAVDTLMGKGSILGFQASDLQGWGEAEVEGMGPGGDRIFDAPSHGQTLPPLSSVATHVGAQGIIVSIPEPVGVYGGGAGGTDRYLIPSHTGEPARC